MAVDQRAPDGERVALRVEHHLRIAPLRTAHTGRQVAGGCKASVCAVAQRGLDLVAIARVDGPQRGRIAAGTDCGSQCRHLVAVAKSGEVTRSAESAVAEAK